MKTFFVHTMKCSNVVRTQASWSQRKMAVLKVWNDMRVFKWWLNYLELSFSISKLASCQNLVSASDVTRMDRWLNVWCIWYTYLETLQECRSRRRIGWIIQDFRETCVSRSLTFRLETKMPWHQTPSWKKKAIIFTNVTVNAYEGRLNAEFNLFHIKVCEIFNIIFKIHQRVSHGGLLLWRHFHTPNRDAERNELWLVVWHVGQMGGPMNAAIHSRPSAVGLKA